MSALHWTLRDDETNVSHQKLLGAGGYGEVHKVLSHFDILTVQMMNTDTGKVCPDAAITESDLCHCND